MIVCKSCQAYTLLKMLMSDPLHQLGILRCPPGILQEFQDFLES
jgi:hypothetical protein